MSPPLRVAHVRFLRWGLHYPARRRIPFPTEATQYAYETHFNQVKTTTDPRGNTTTNFFDYEEATLGDLNDDGITNQASGNIVQVQMPPTTLPDGSVQNPIRKVQYNPLGQMTREIQPEGNVTEYQYYATGPSTGYLQKILRDPGGIACENTYEYDAVGIVTRQTDGFARATDFEVNELNQVQKTTSRQAALLGGGTVRDESLNHYDFHNKIDLTEVQNSTDEGVVLPPIRTEFDYDLLCNMIEKREQTAPGVFITTTYAYDANENLIELAKPNGNKIGYAYDQRDLRISETRGAGSPEAATTQTRYDENGNRVQAISGEGRTTSYVYDGYDRLVNTIDADGNLTLRTHDANGNVTEVVRKDDQNNTLSRTVNTYDEFNRLIAGEMDHFDENGTPVGDGVSRTESFLDKNSRLVRTVNDNNHDMVYDYDSLDRRVLTTDALGNTVAQAIRLDSNGDWGAIPHAPSLAPTSALTVEFWVKADSFQPAEPDGYFGVVDKSHRYWPPVGTDGAWYF